MADGFIYFAHMRRADHGHCYKVGFSTQPEYRVASLGSRFQPCTMLLFVPGRIEDEQAIHCLLSRYAVRNEWYRPNRRLQRLMAYCAERGAMPPSVIASGDAWATRRKANRDFVLSQTAMGKEISGDLVLDLRDPWKKGQQGPANDDISWLPPKALERLNEALFVRANRT